ncbi:hypothetical protein ACFOLF_16415 [Paenibacillus sepulcri]|uniref:WxL domain-containing protein n=1 Tax=Paenibacillus sepulcri TaxID=359917 RepID=A0ABS7BX00_9BACL|nr:hypothetical protein [Paenibacillus sepulcri]
MFKKKFLVGSLTTALLLTGGISAAFASDFQVLGTDYQSFSLVVPGNNVNDSRGETGSQTKSTSGAQAGLQMNSTGGSSLDVRTESPNGDGSWKDGVTSSETYAINSPQLSGSDVHLQFSTGLLQGPVTVTGNWRSN